MLICFSKDREAEPRFTGPPAGRGGYEGGPGRGGFGGGYGGAPGGGGGSRQIYVSNVCDLIPSFSFFLCWMIELTYYCVAPLLCRLARSEGSVPSSR